VGQTLNSFQELKESTCWIGTLFNMEEEKYRIPLFDGNNYLDWKFHMSVYLDELDLLKHIETPISQLWEKCLEPENGEAAAVTAVQTATNGQSVNMSRYQSHSENCDQILLSV
jgi:hypothetical protein